MRLLVTGGAGFIGSNLIRLLLRESDAQVLNVDRLSSPGAIHTLDDLRSVSRHEFRQIDICETAALETLLSEFRPAAILHLAAETHVDRSIDGPADFIRSNILGTFSLLEAARKHWALLPAEAKHAFRFIHISTDEVHGTLGPHDAAWVESDPYRPSSPYAASKAASDHLVHAWHRTYGLPTIITNCCNNYGPYQFPEKLIPLMITKALSGETLPVYGTGGNVRDWLYVEDHARALHAVLMRGSVGEQYHVGSGYERTNLEMVRAICLLLDELLPDARRGDRERLISFVTDRPGHDFRYAMNAGKIQAELGWCPREDLGSGLRKTVQWYLSNLDWCRRVTAGVYQGQRLGLG